MAGYLPFYQACKSQTSYADLPLIALPPGPDALPRINFNDVRAYFDGDVSANKLYHYFNNQKFFSRTMYNKYDQDYLLKVDANANILGTQKTVFSIAS